MTTTIDRAGRIVVPKSLRERFNLVAGTELEIEVQGECLQFRRVAAEPVLVAPSGVVDALRVSVQPTASERASAFLTALPSRFDSLPSLRMIRVSSSVKSLRRILQGTWSPALRHS